MKEKAMTEMPTFNAYVLPLVLHSLPPQFLGWIFIIFSFELDQGFRESFRFCENISRTLKVSRGRNKSSHFREPFGFPSKLTHFLDIRYPREYKTVATFHEVADSGFSLCVIIFLLFL
jgi:hypothetical protein